MWANPGVINVPLPYPHISTPVGLQSYPGYPLGLVNVVPDYGTIHAFYGEGAGRFLRMQEFFRLQRFLHPGYQFNPSSPFPQLQTQQTIPSYSSLANNDKSCHSSPISTIPSANVPIWQLSPITDEDQPKSIDKVSQWLKYQESTPISTAKGHLVIDSAKESGKLPRVDLSFDHHSLISPEDSTDQSSREHQESSKRARKLIERSASPELPIDHGQNKLSLTHIARTELFDGFHSDKSATVKISAHDSVSSLQSEPLDLSVPLRTIKRPRDDSHTDTSQIKYPERENKRIKLEALSPGRHEYKCRIEDCTSLFATKQGQIRHEMSHTAVYNCLFSNCDKQYSEIRNLQNHLTGHKTNDKTQPARDSESAPFLPILPITIPVPIKPVHALPLSTSTPVPMRNILKSRVEENMKLQPNEKFGSLCKQAKTDKTFGHMDMEEKQLAEEMFRQDKISRSDHSTSIEESGSSNSASESADSGNGSAENIAGDIGSGTKKFKVLKALHLWTKQSDNLTTNKTENDWKLPEENERVFFCVQCDFQTFEKEKAKSHKRLLQHKVKQRCTLCDKEFSYQGDTWSHIQQMHRPYHLRPFRCPYEGCDGAYSMQKLLNFHCKYVHSEKTFLCPHPGCGKRYATQSMLKHHQFVHTEMFQCTWSGCGKTFRDDYNLRTHYMIHTGKKPRQCKLCVYSCVQKNSMDWHMKSKHKETLLA